MHAHPSRRPRRRLTAPRTLRRLPLLLLATALALPFLCACQAGGLSRLGAASGGGNSGRYRSDVVNLSDADLQPVDRYLHASNRQWILGDTVDIYASKEYFSGMLTMNAKIGLVHRQDSRAGDDDLSVLTFIGDKSQASAMVNPRALVGTAITVTARKTLRVRMAKTTDASRPVQLRIVAQGNASRGVKEDITGRGPQLEIGGLLVKENGNWVWKEIGG